MAKRVKLIMPNGKDEIEVWDSEVEYFETLELIENSHLSPKEEQFILLRLEGLTMEEITEDLDESAYKIRQRLRDKFLHINNGKQKFI